MGNYDKRALQIQVNGESQEVLEVQKMCSWLWVPLIPLDKVSKWLRNEGNQSPAVTVCSQAVE